MKARATAHDSLRTAAQELEELIAELNRSSEAFGGNTKRKLRRWAYTGKTVVIDLIEGGRQRRLLTAPRDLSAGGMCVLHGGFIHPGVACIVHLKTVNGEETTIKGQMVRCRHVRGRLHESGICFASKIQPERFTVLKGGQGHLESVEPGALQGDLLVCTSDPATQRQVAHLLKDTKLQVAFAASCDEAIDRLSALPDAVLVDEQVSDVDGIEVIRTLRAEGVHFPLGLLQPEGSTTRPEGIGAVAHKPLQSQPFLFAVAELLHRSAA